MRWLYNLFLFLYRQGIILTAQWNAKAKAWVDGRVGWEQSLAHSLKNWPGATVYWMHCASLGEFEQGRPLLEALKQQQPNCRILLSFFSPSGYEAQKDFAGADHVCYLPLDGYNSARQFLDIVQPQLALFVKYEFWYYYLQELSRRNVKTVLVSGAFRTEQIFFKWYGGFFRRILRNFSLITVQDEVSQALLLSRGFVSVHCGDTRYDRVLAIAAQGRSLPKVEQFKGKCELIVAGSTWPQDEALLHQALSLFPTNWKLVLAPHEISPEHLQQIKNLLGDQCVFYSELEEGTAAKVLVIDNIGMLSSLYRYGAFAWIGGGFSKSGIHNILEPAVFGLPSIFGPYYEKFSEARAIVALGCGFPVKKTEDWTIALQTLFQEEQRKPLQQKLRTFVQTNAGATEKIIKLIRLHN
ncbi:MAG: 3-deoxy-D-manno-octulosonic acid transferase [Bacteroidetes bacterium]|nr:3-deoxy-D-manno-octulosonic acid transferase [Bacteroidota bacterium]